MIDDLQIWVSELELIEEEYSCFYHRKSMINFIKNIDNIKNDDYKLKAYNLIVSYFNEIRNEPIYDMERAKYIFTKFISPLGLIYTDYASFTSNLRFWVFGIWILVLLGLTYSTMHSVMITSVISLFLLLFYLHKIYKKFLGMVFGFLW